MVALNKQDMSYVSAAKAANAGKEPSLPVRADTAPFKEPPSSPPLRAEAAEFKAPPSSPTLRAEAAPFKVPPSSPTLRAEAAPFVQPPSSPNLRAEATTFEPPPPGLGLLDLSASAESSYKWGAQDVSSSPGSTVLPCPGSSPWLCSGTGSILGGPSSPYMSPYMSPWVAPASADLDGSFAFELPDAHLELSEPAESTLCFADDGLCAEDASEDSGTQFTLEGLTGLEDCLASLLGRLSGDGAGLGELGASIVDGLAKHGAQNAAGMKTSTPGEDASGGASTQPSADEQGAESGTDIPSTPRSASDSQAAPSSPAESPKRTGWGAKAADPDLPPLPARVRASPATLPASATTTMLLRNVSRRSTPADFEELLAKAGVIQDIDFLYVPMDLKGKCGVGYIFINFRTEEAGEKFKGLFHGRAAKEFGGKGALEVLAAPIQGREVNVQKLQRSGVLMSMLADKPAWLPRLFDGEGAQEDFPTLVN